MDKEKYILDVFISVIEVDERGTKVKEHFFKHKDLNDKALNAVKEDVDYLLIKKNEKGGW
jgi:hypothetical protein